MQGLAERHRSMRVLLSTCVLALALACASSPRITFDPEQDWSRHRTWDWLPGTARTIETPTDDLLQLDRELARLIESALAQRGFTRDRKNPDLRIGGLLNYYYREAA